MIDKGNKLNWFRYLFEVVSSYLYIRLLNFIFFYQYSTGTKQDHSELHASFNIIRVGQYYRLINYGETYEFEALEIINNDDCIVRSVDTLEKYRLSDLIKFGKGADFNFEEI